MSCHLIDLSRDVSPSLLERFHFRGIRRTPGEIPAERAGASTFLCNALVDCQLGAPPRTGTQCLACPRLLSWQRGASERDLDVMCLWTHDDPVAARMTARPAVVTVPPSLSCIEAARVATRESVHRLLVVEGDALAGIVCEHDLLGHGDDSVSQHMHREVYVISAASTLGEAAAAMQLVGVGCLPVTRDDHLVGVVTRGDLVRAGMPAHLL